ncbi:MFS transporter, DHA1 family, bicyclomycin/chloramphenicol resistance protein [Amycolatopsis xylanica]|uniref:MFS transporter, DHA1 family, bicyclomycin/chloramphenicol resistance protein n=1 Tax=Amycolatopsis xylanica TaxID=589385 RepID=A0A1H3QX41_9PSEU|nr:Bcr/CflA family multidrug efflux MFS transporter [Amycolatopsis xylanica]SDZ17605.1 MFS transporter, DHA1 family, bicyclomycin/chloramphenicol resistance protein [Amycolatopsis xylanica]
MSTTLAEPTASVQVRTHSRLRYALVLGGLSAFGPLSIDMYLPAFPSMTADFRSTPSTLQLTLSAFIIGLALGQVVIGPLSDALGRRRPLLAGLALYVIGSALCAFAPTAELLIAARVVQAIGAAAGIVIARATVRDLFSGIAMTKFFSMLMLVNGLAPILAPIIGGQVLRVTSWRGVFVVLVVFGALLLTVVALALPEPLPEDRRVPARPRAILRTYFRLLRDRTFMGYTLASGLMFAGLFAYISGSSFVLQDVYGLSPQAYALAFGINGIGIVAVGQLNGAIVGRFPERVLLRFGLFSSVVGGLLVLLAVVLHWGLIGLLAGLFVVVSSIGMVAPNASSLGLAEQAGNAGAASALMGVLQFLVGGLATPLVGLGGSGTALPMVIVIAAFTALALLAYLTLTREKNPNVAFVSS